MFSKKKKTEQTEVKKDREISLVNDCDDLRFTLFLGPTPQEDGWNAYHCSLMVKDPRTGQFKSLYSSGDGSVVSDIPTQDTIDLVNFLKKALEIRNQTHEFVSETQDFSLSVASKEDIFRITASIDLSTYTSEKLEAGYGDSVVSLSYGSTQQEVSQFCEELSAWVSAK